MVYLPCHNNEEIQSVPCVPKVALLAKNAQGHHLEHHLHGKEDKDEVIKDLQGQEEDKEARDSVRSQSRTEGWSHSVRWEHAHEHEGPGKDLETSSPGPGENLRDPSPRHSFHR